MGLLRWKPKKLRFGKKKSTEVCAIRPIRFYCGCGKEMWESIDYEKIKFNTIESILDVILLKCSDCIFQEIRDNKD